MGRLALVGSVGFAIALGAPAHADPAQADRLVAEAETLASGEHFADAAKRYREAFAADPRPELICNVGVAYYKAKDLPRAHRYLEQCLAIGRSLEPAYVANLRQVLGAVETSLRNDGFIPVELAVEPQTASIAIVGSADEPLVGSSHAWLKAGTYRVTGHAEGYIDRTVDVEVTSTAVVPVVIKLERVPVARPVRPSSRRPALYASIASAGVGLLAGTSYLWALHRGTQSGAPDATLADHDRDADSAHTYQHLAWGLGIAAIVGAGVSGYLWHRASATVEVAPSPGGVAVALTGRW